MVAESRTIATRVETRITHSSLFQNEPLNVERCRASVSTQSGIPRITENVPTPLSLISCRDISHSSYTDILSGGRTHRTWELAKTASVRFLSVGLSNLSLIEGDPRSNQKTCLNKRCQHRILIACLSRSLPSPANAIAPCFHAFHRSTPSIHGMRCAK